MSLQSAAVFRMQGAAFARTTGIGWEGATLHELARNDSLVQRLIADGPVLRLDKIHWQHAGTPRSPHEPVVAIVLTQAGSVIGVAFYGRHRNETEIDPEELALLRRLCEAAAVAYQTAAMRAELVELRQLRLDVEAETA